MLKTLFGSLLLVLICSGSGKSQAQPAECLREGSVPEANATPLKAITFGADRFVAVGSEGIVLMSTNAVNWLRQPGVTAAFLNGVTFGDGMFVAVGEGGVVLRSTNGTDWVAGQAGVSDLLRRVVYGNGRYVALADGNHASWSSNAITWEATTNGIPNGPYFEGLFYGAGLFVACGSSGRIIVSSDGANWTNANAPVTLSMLTCGAYGNGVYLAAGWGSFGSDQVARSTDGLNWITQRRNSCNSFCYGGGPFVGSGPGNAIQITPDGTTWTNDYVTASTDFQVVAFGMGQFVAVGLGGAIYTSTNGIAWTRRNLEVCPIRATAEGNGVVVAISGDYGMIYSSEDNVPFQRHRDPGGILVSINLGRGLFATVGNAGILISSDGTNWTVVPHPDSETLWSIRHENGVWVTVGRIIMVSTDGTNWVTPVSNAGYLTDLIYGNGRFVSFGWDGVIWSSADGTNWLNVSFNTLSDLNGGVFQDGLFSLHGAYSATLPAPALVSRDGVTWSDPTPTGALLAIKPASAISPLALVLAGEWAQSYVVEVSTNLTGWADALNVTNLAGVTTVPLSASSGEPGVFFRVRTN